MSALPPIADILGVNIDVRFVPLADVTSLMDPVAPRGHISALRAALPNPLSKNWPQLS